MHDAIDATMDSTRAGRTYKSRVDDFGATPLPLKATIEAVGSKTFATTVFSFTERESSTRYHGIKYQVTGTLGFEDGNGLWVVHEAQNCDQAVLDNADERAEEARDLPGGAKALGDGYSGMWTTTGPVNKEIGGPTSAPESIVGRTVVVYCADGTPCGCGVIKRNWLRDDITTDSTVTTVDPDAFAAGAWGATNPAVGDSRRQRHLASNVAGYSVQTAVACGEYCDKLSELLTNDCLSFKSKMADFGVKASCPRTTAVYTAPTSGPTTSPTQGQRYDGKVVYKKEFGTLIQQSALEKKYEHATIVLGVFCFVLLILVIFLVVRSPGSGGGDKEGSPVRGSQLEDQLSV
jgi:hypothetical protein